MKSVNLLCGAKLFYPTAREWMWSYCIYLGPFTDSSGKNYDLGIYLPDGSLPPVAAIVYGHNDNNYLSGTFGDIQHESRECYLETYRRVKELNLL